MHSKSVLLCISCSVTLCKHIKSKFQPECTFYQNTVAQATEVFSTRLIPVSSAGLAPPTRKWTMTFLTWSLRLKWTSRSISPTLTFATWCPTPSLELKALSCGRQETLSRDCVEFKVLLKGAFWSRIFSNKCVEDVFWWCNQGRVVRWCVFPISYFY